MANTWVNREDPFLSLKFSVNDSGGSRAALVTGMGSAEMKRERRTVAGRGRPAGWRAGASGKVLPLSLSSGATSLEEGDWGAGS